MRPGRHAAEDGSFKRSAGMAVGRAALLLLVAVILGIFLLNQIDDDGTATTVGQSTETTEPPDDAATATTAPTTPTTVRAAKPAASVKVLAVNGTNTGGVGARIKDVLIREKYNALAPTDAVSKLKPIKATVIYYQPGYDVDALAVATLFQLTVANTKAMPEGMAAQVRDSKQVANANVIIMAGDDIVPKLPAPSSTTTTAKPAGSTTTTAKPAGSTTTTAKPASTTTTARP